MNSYKRQFTISLCVLLCSLSAWGEAKIQLVALPGAVRVSQTGDANGQSIAELFCAKNETESFQIVVTARGGNLLRVNVEISPLIDSQGNEIPKDRIQLYREIFVPVRNSSPRATEPPGLFPDPLVPFLNPYTGEPVKGAHWDDDRSEGIRFGGTGFDVWQDRNQPVWIDISVPENAAPGLYQGEARVKAREGEEAAIPVRLTVWDFTLPQGPSHENHFGSFSSLAGYYEIKRDSERYRLLEDRYIETMAQHRLNPPIPTRLQPKLNDDGSILADSDFDRALTEFVGKYHLTNIEIPHAPFSDVLKNDRAKAILFYRSWYAYLQSKGWDKGAYLYMLDEPNDRDAYEQVRQLGALVKEANPGIRRLVVEQPYTQDPAWGVLDEAIDIWCPLFSFIHEPSVKKVIGQGDVVWSYSALVQSTPDYNPDYERVKNDNPPYWQIDFPVSVYRIAPWLNRRYGVTGLLYWSTVYWQSPKRNVWDDPGFRINFNGDGFLFYPGDDAGIEGPVASIRLKNLRDGMEDYEYFAILQQRGGNEIVDQIVRQNVPTWGTWDQNPDRLLERRKQLAEEIQKR